MNPIFTVAALLAAIAWSDGRLVFDIPGFGQPAVHRGVK
jgi:hypothetical protein